MARFIDEIVSRWRYGGVLVRLIFVNLAVFLALRAGAVVITLSGGNPDSLWLQWVELPSDLSVLVHRPWTLVTYMFAQYGILHLLFNMLWLYWFGRFFLFGNTPKQLFALYILGGVAGAALYIVAFNMLPYFANSLGWMLGSSASVLAIVVATAWRMPDYRVGLLFLGDVALKWIAVVTVLFSLLSISGENAGGNIAHIGGAMMGALYGRQQNCGVDVTRWFNRLIDALVDGWRSLSDRHVRKQRVQASASKKSSEKPNDSGISEAEEQSIDIILDKIKKSGYSSLTADERKRLFDASSRIK